MRQALLLILILIFSRKLTFSQQAKLILPIGHTLSVQLAHYSPYNKLILTASSDHSAKVWDAVTGTLLYTIAGHTDAILSAEFSPNGKLIATAIVVTYFFMCILLF